MQLLCNINRASENRIKSHCKPHSHLTSIVQFAGGQANGSGPKGEEEGAVEKDENKSQSAAKGVENIVKSAEKQSGKAEKLFTKCVCCYVFADFSVRSECGHKAQLQKLRRKRNKASAKSGRCRCRCLCMQRERREQQRERNKWREREREWGAEWRRQSAWSERAHWQRESSVEPEWILIYENKTSRERRREAQREREREM